MADKWWKIDRRWVWPLLGREIFIGQNHFLLKMFYHCFLPGMMRRLQANLRKYRRDMGETKLSE